jgi:NDP-sugar pyrophosphorylase family protein
LQFGDDNAVSGFQEKPQGDGSWFNGGFFVLDLAVIDRIKGAPTTWEQEPLRGLAADDPGRPDSRHSSEAKFHLSGKLRSARLILTS